AVIGREGHLDGAGVLILICSLLPGSAAIERAEEAALGVRAVRMPEDGDKNAVGIARVNGDGTDLLAVAQAEMLPGLAGVGGFVDAVAGGEVGAAQSFAAAHVNNFGIGGRDGQRADGLRGLIVENGRPGLAGVGGLPDAAVVHANVENIGL